MRANARPVSYTHLDVYKRQIYVSCDPMSLGRDAAVLRNAGYRLEKVTPIDQFLWSARLEAVAVFRVGR